MNFALGDAYDDGRSIQVDAGAIIFNGINEDTNVLSVTGDGDSAGALISFSHTTNTRNDLLGTGSTWNITGQGYATLVRVFASGYISTDSAADLVLHTNSSTNSSVITINHSANGDIVCAMDGTGQFTISGTTETNVGFQLTNGDMVVSDGSFTLDDDDAATCFSITHTGDANSVVIVANSVTTNHVLDITGDGITTGKLLHLDMTEAGATDGTGMYIECYDNTANAAQFTVGLNGDVTINGNANTDVLTLDNGDLVISDGSLTMTDGDNDVSFIVTNDNATTSDVFAIVGAGTFSGTGASAFARFTASGLTSGDAVSITTDAMTTGTALLLSSSGTLVTSGAMLEIIADSATSAAGVFRMSTDGLVDGNAILIDQTGEALTSGELLTITNTESGTLAVKTDNLCSISSSLTETAATRTENYDMLLLSRTDVMSFAGTYTAQGSVLRIVHVATQSSGTLTDTVGGIEIDMDVDGTGNALDIVSLATDAECIDVSGAATSVDDVNILGTGVHADNTAVLHATTSGATAAGGAVLRVSQSGIPAAATSYLVDFDATGGTTSNNPDLLHIANSGTGRVVHITTSGAASPAVDIESTEGGTTGPILRLNHQGGSQTNGDVVARIQFQGEDSGSADESYGRIDCIVRDTTAANPDNDILFYVNVAGTETLKFELPFDVDGVAVGTGAAHAVVQSAGNYNLILQTGNSTTGNITITDGAAGTITLAPEGNGAIDLAGAIFHSETTVSGGGAQAVAVTGAIHEMTTTGADAVSLVDGTEGQILKIILVSDGGDATLTPTSPGGYSTITFADAGDSVTLLFSNAVWYVVGQGGLGTGPVVA